MPSERLQINMCFLQKEFLRGINEFQFCAETKKYKMKKVIIVALHIFYWLTYAMLFYSLLLPNFLDYYGAKDFSAHIHALRQVLYSLIISAPVFYIVYGFLVPRFLAERKIKQFVLYVLLLILLMIIFYNCWSFFVLRYHRISVDAIVRGIIGNAIFVFMQCGYNAVAATLLKSLIIWYSDIRVKQNLEKKNLQMESSLIKAQLNPHFLFNTLNNIDSIIHKDANVASDYLNKLSDILRFLIYKCNADKISLGLEIEYIQKYIELQKIRLNNDEQIIFAMNGEITNQQIAPMIFIPFIENAFKHNTHLKGKNNVEILFGIQENNIEFICKNTFKKSSEIKDESGVGMGLIKQRLDLLYKNYYELNIHNNDGIYTVDLKLNLHED